MPDPEKPSQAFVEPPPLPRPRFRLITLLPLASAVLEVPWIIVIVFLQLFITGGVARNPHQTHLLDAIAMIPVAAGLIVGCIIIARGKLSRRVAEGVCLGIGGLGCGLFLFSFAWELFH
jgi:hypothetical protein